MDSQIINLLDEELNKLNVLIIPQHDIQRITPEVGEGKFGKVYKGIYNGHTVAIKKMIIQDLDMEEVKTEVINEIKNLQYALCDHVPKFFGVWKGNKGNHYNLIFEFVEGMNLRNLLPSLSLDDKIFILHQTAEIVNFLHKKKLFHRDIKPENIMVNVNTKNIKMIDFGTAKLATKTVTFTARAVGTTIYMAPDFFLIDVDDDEEKPIANTQKVDIWSIGCMISEMLSGIPPWQNLTKSESKVEAYLIKGTNFPIPKEISEKFPEFLELIQKCTKVDWKERCDAGEILRFLTPKLKNY